MEKYPEVQQKFRFVKVVLRRAETDAAGRTETQEAGMLSDAGKAGEDEGARKTGGPMHQNTGKSTAQGKISAAENEVQDAKADHADSGDSEDIGAVHPLLMKFLDAETYDQRLGIFDEMEGIADMHMLNAVAASLDVTLGDTTIEEAFSLIRDNLATQKKYGMAAGGDDPSAAFFEYSAFVYSRGIILCCYKNLVLTITV